MKLSLSLHLPDELCAELKDAARESGCSPNVFAAQAIEATLAARRLPGITPGKCGARLIGTAHEPEELPDRENFVALEPLSPVELPLVDDLEGLADIA